MSNRAQRILVVDDLYEWQDSLSGLLRDYGYQTETAGTTAGAKQLLAEHQFDLALLDIRLDDSDEENTEGLALGEYIRATYPDTHVIILTGFGRIEYATRIMQPGDQAPRVAYDFVIKSEPKRLLASVEEVLARKQ
ncbi:MAG: response regulator [Anaerolinea sp.]|nr:response regulator [Anaerolinea sp.]